MNPAKNMAASVKQRLLNLARERREDLNLLLNQYGVERLLYRLGESEYRDEFVLKGAALFKIWTGARHRPTRDLDLLIRQPANQEQLQSIFSQVCSLDVQDDGMAYIGESIGIEPIRQESEFGGLRMRLDSLLGTARIRIQVDIGTGDAMVPTPELAEYPVLLDLPAPRLHVYCRETVVSEKLQTAVELGFANSRMRDLYDIWFLATTFDFAGVTLCSAINATFSSRRTAIPESPPTVLTPDFADDRMKQSQWQAFLERAGLEEPRLEFGAVITYLREFLLPPLTASRRDETLSKFWRAGEGWEETNSGPHPEVPQVGA